MPKEKDDEEHDMLDEQESKAIDMFFDAKFTELLNYAKENHVSGWWKDKAVSMLMKLKELGMTEQFLQHYVEILVESCELNILSNSYYIVEPEKKGRDRLLVVRITIDHKHVTEGGRVAEAMSDMNLELYDQLHKKYSKFLKRVTFRLRIEGYDDEEDDFPPDHGDDEDDNGCGCAVCEAERSERIKQSLMSGTGTPRLH